MFDIKRSSATLPDLGSFAALGEKKAKLDPSPQPIPCASTSVPPPGPLAHQATRAPRALVHLRPRRLHHTDHTRPPLSLSGIHGYTRGATHWMAVQDKLPEGSKARLAIALAYVSGYVDVNLLSRAGLFATGISGDICKLCIQIVALPTAAPGTQALDIAFTISVISSFILGTMLAHVILSSPRVRRFCARIGACIRVGEDHVVLLCVTFTVMCMITLSEAVGYATKLSTTTGPTPQWEACFAVVGVASFNETAHKIAGMPTVQFMSGHTQTVTKSTMDFFCLIPKSDALGRTEACKKAKSSGGVVVAYTLGGFCSIGMLRLMAWLTGGNTTWSLMPMTLILFVYGVIELQLAARSGPSGRSALRANAYGNA